MSTESRVTSNAKRFSAVPPFNATRDSMSHWSCAQPPKGMGAHYLMGRMSTARRREWFARFATVPQNQVSSTGEPSPSSWMTVGQLSSWAPTACCCQAPVKVKSPPVPLQESSYETARGKVPVALT